MTKGRYPLRCRCWRWNLVEGTFWDFVTLFLFFSFFFEIFENTTVITHHLKNFKTLNESVGKFCLSSTIALITLALKRFSILLRFDSTWNPFLSKSSFRFQYFKGFMLKVKDILFHISWELLGYLIRICSWSVYSSQKLSLSRWNKIYFNRKKIPSQRYESSSRSVRALRGHAQTIK